LLDLHRADHDVVDRVLIIGRFDDEERCFEVFGEIGCVVTVEIFFVIFETLGNREAITLILN